MRFICIVFMLLSFGVVCFAQVPETTTTTSSNPANLPDPDCVNCGTSNNVDSTCCNDYTLMINSDSTFYYVVKDLVVVDSVLIPIQQVVCEELKPCVFPNVEDDYINDLPRDTVICINAIKNDNHMLGEDIEICSILSVSPSTVTATIDKENGGQICIAVSIDTYQDVEVEYCVCDENGQEDCGTIYLEQCDYKFTGGDNQGFVIESGDPNDTSIGSIVIFENYNIAFTKPPYNQQNGANNIMGGMIQAPACALVERTLLGVTFWDIQHTNAHSIELCSITFDNGVTQGSFSNPLGVIPNTGIATWGYNTEIFPATSPYVNAGVVAISEVGAPTFLFQGQVSNWASYSWECESQPLPVRMVFKHSCDPTVPIILTLNTITY